MTTTTKKRSTKSNGNGKSPEQIYQAVTDRIVASLEEGHIPWHRPWRSKHNGGVHMNVASKRAYRGINQFILDIRAMESGYDRPYWMTFNQAKAMGGTVRKGEKSEIVIFWKIINRTTDEVDDDGKKIVKKIPLLRYYRVFNVDQIDGIDEKIPAVEEDEEFTPIERAEKVCKGMQKAPKTYHKYNRAFYRPSADFIGMPKPEDFDSPEHYYSTRFHEMVHSTGHESRIHRIKDWTAFGEDPYAQEELVAEMGAAMLAGITDIAIPSVEKNEEAYIKSWIKRFKDDKKMLVHAAAQAQKAADFIIENGKDS